VITIHGKCNMCGNFEASIEVDVPHATAEKKKALGIGSTSVMCAALCRTCTRAAVAAWAKHGAAEWARVREERIAAEADDS
jgi:hypothetical protein